MGRRRRVWRDWGGGVGCEYICEEKTSGWKADQDYRVKLANDVTYKRYVSRPGGGPEGPEEVGYGYGVLML